MPRVISPTLARRLFVTRQRLAGPRPPHPDAAALFDVVRTLGCVQLDPISAVARTHLLVPFSRLGPYDPRHWDTLLWQERRVFEYWAHAASIVLTEDYPIFYHWMRMYGTDGRASSARFKEWVKNNDALRRSILKEIRKRGPLPSRFFEDDTRRTESALGWPSDRNVSLMLDYLWTTGKIMVAGRQGIQKLWDLTERVLPEWISRERLTEREVVRRSVENSLRALGVGTPQHIVYHFTRGRYPGLKETLASLEKEGRIERVEMRDKNEEWAGNWYVHTVALAEIGRLETEDWEPRTTLLSPFDNLIADRKRTRQFFDFDFTIEIYVPPAKRKYGYYVLPLLHGDRLIGRVDPQMDRERRVLTVNAVYAEPGAKKMKPRETGRAVLGAIEELAAFLGAKEIVYAKKVPEAWKQQLK